MQVIFIRRHQRGLRDGTGVAGGIYRSEKEGARCVLGTSTFGVWNEDAYQLFMDVDTLGRLLETMDSTTLRAAKIAKALEKFTLIVDFEQPRKHGSHLIKKREKH